jgi:hypothetical protein
VSRARAAKAVLTLIAVCAALAVLIAGLLPAPTIHVNGVAPDPLTVRGSLHVHTLRSDGTGSVEDVAAAAGRAGLQFVVLMDHGDGTREPDAPVYRSGVLVIDAVEISTTGGHYAALGLGRAPYRLAGEPRDVVDDVARLGGFGIVAHPDSPKDDLRWRDWTLPFDAIEWLNADSEWRNEGSVGVARALATYWWRGPETVAAGFDRPDTPFAEWDTVSQYRRVIGVAGHDAHARMGPRGNWEPGERDLSLKLPGFETAFRTFAERVHLAAPLTGNAGRDSASILDAIRAGHLYTVIDALASPAAFRFEARSGTRIARAGDDLPVGDAALLEADVARVPGVSLVLRRNGRVVAASDSGELRYEHAASNATAVYRVEAKLPDAPGTPPVPWIVGNPIFVGPALPRVRRQLEASPATDAEVVSDGGDTARWHTEQDVTSRAVVALREAPWGGQALALSYGLGPGVRAGQYAALVTGVGQGSLPRWTRVGFRAAADAAMRLSVQLRAPGTGARWIRSVVVEPRPQLLHVPFVDMVPVDPAALPIPLGDVDSLLFVVDTTNTPTGRHGTVWIDGVRLERAPDPQVRTVNSR